MKVSVIIFGVLLAGALVSAVLGQVNRGNPAIEVYKYIQKRNVNEDNTGCDDQEVEACDNNGSGQPTEENLPEERYPEPEPEPQQPEPEPQQPEPTPQQPEPTPQQPLKCDTRVMNGEFGNKKKEYILAPRKMTWLDAVAYCKRNCAALATIMNNKERLHFDTIVSYTKPHSEQPWLGGKCNFDYDCRWSNTNNKMTGFNRWKTGEPKTNFGKFKCITLQGDDDDHWILKRCDEKRSFVCHKYTFN